MNAPHIVARSCKRDPLVILRNAWRFLGCGDPRTAKVWFVGLEESVEFQTLEEILKLQLEPYRTCPGRHGERTAVYVIISKIILGLRDGTFNSSWRSYRDVQLFSKGSAAFLANLYPLGKKSEADWPARYQRWFGMSREEYYRWLREDARYRFTHLRRKRRQYGNPLVICFGKGQWKNFCRCFLTNDEPTRDMGRFCCYMKSRVILTEFFRSTRMPDASIKELVRFISLEGLNPFLHDAKRMQPQTRER